MCKKCSDPLRRELSRMLEPGVGKHQAMGVQNLRASKQVGQCSKCGQQTFYFWPSHHTLHSRLGFKLASLVIALRCKILPPHPDSAPPLRD